MFAKHHRLEGKSLDLCLAEARLRINVSLEGGYEPLGTRSKPSFLLRASPLGGQKPHAENTAKLRCASKDCWCRTRHFLHVLCWLHASGKCWFVVPWNFSGSCYSGQQQSPHSADAALCKQAVAAPFSFLVAGLRVSQRAF